MKAIYASRMFKASKRQQSISAAIQNPINAELVQQLEEYLNDIEPELTEDGVDHSESVDNEIKDSPDDMDGRLNNRTHIDTEDILVDDADVNDEDVDDDNADADDNSGSDEESRGEKVTSATTLYNNVHQDNTTVDVSSKIEVIRGTLNSRSDTCGVNRILLREDDSELWIHYEDRINLNNVMGSVIELLNGLSYTYLEFNRLARSENAIVFEIHLEEADSTVSDISKEGKTDE